MTIENKPVRRIFTITCPQCEESIEIETTTTPVTLGGDISADQVQVRWHKRQERKEGERWR